MLAAARLYTLSVEARSGSLAAHCLVGGIPQPRGSPSFLWRDNPASANLLQGRVISITFVYGLLCGLYAMLPAQRPPWQAIFPGAFLTRVARSERPSQSALVTGL